MKLKLDAAAFASAATWVARYALPPRGGASPVLTGVLATWDGDRLTLTAQDYERYARVEVPASGDETATVLLPAALLAQVAKILPDEPMTLTVEGSRAELECGRLRFGLPTLEAYDYPPAPELPAVLGTVDGTAFARAVKRVASAAERDERARPSVRAMYLEAEGDGVWLAATNASCVSAETVEMVPAGEVEAKVLVPAQALAGVAAEVSGEVGLHADDRAVAVSWPGRVVRTAVVVAEVPRYRDVLNRFAERTWAEVEIADLAEALRHVQVAAPDTREMPSHATLTLGRSEILVEAAGEATKASEVVPARWDGAEFALTFRTAYLLAALGSLDGETARIGFASEDGVPRSVEFASVVPDTDHRFLVQPIRPRAAR